MSDRRATDDGFTLVEIMVALGIFLVVMTAVLPLMVAAVKGAASAGQATEQKGVVEGQFERMRNLPWHVAPNAGQFIDVLDRYYPNRTAPTATVNATACAGFPASGWTGYVQTSARCSYEPAYGDATHPNAFYRTVETVDPEGPGAYLVVTDVQFLTSVAPVSPASYSPAPVAVPSGYDTTQQGSDTPISQEVGVTVTAFDLRSSTPKPFTDYTQIAEDVRSPKRVQAVAETAAIELTGVTRQGTSVGVTAGSLDLNGFLAKLSSASGRLSAVEARQGSNDPVGLQAGPFTASAPAKLPPAVGTEAGDLTTPAQCDFICWGTTWYSGQTTTSDVTVSSTNGLPLVGSSTAPVQAGIQGGIPAGSTALGFSNTPVAEREYYRRADLGLVTDSLVTVASTATSLSGCGASGSGEALGRGYVNTSATTVTSCAETGASTVSLFPTKDRPAGVLDVKLDYARTSCSSAHGGARSAVATYSVTVTAHGPGGGTLSKTFKDTDSQTARDDAVTALLDYSVVGGLPLDQYVASLTPAVATTSTTVASTASASVPAALTLVSTDMRNKEPYDPSGSATTSYTHDEDSTFTLRLGAVSCQALDAR